jgi:ribose/xylose/arabinose/galactoside ABC-type transport system permease subunit
MRPLRGWNRPEAAAPSGIAASAVQPGGTSGSDDFLDRVILRKAPEHVAGDAGDVVVVAVVRQASGRGHRIFMVGGNKEAARLAGVNVDAVTLAIYGLGGLYAGIAGVVLLGTTNVGQPQSAGDWPPSAIAAVVVGGVPLSGGVGGVGRVVLGTLLLGIVANALNLTGVSPYWQPAVTGAVILISEGIDSYQRKLRALR